MKVLNLKKKLILGTANFSQKYGADNIKLDLNEIKKVLNYAKLNNIKKIDTAHSYLNDINYINLLKNRFKIITKITPNNNWSSSSFCEKWLINEIKYLDNNKIETILFHDVKVLFTNSGKKIFKNLENLKKKGYFKKIGVSIYEFDCLKYLLSNYKFDIIQCPYNILDKRVVSSGWLNILKKKGIEVHARSIFLQGLLVNKKVYKKSNFRKWKEKFSQWFYFLKERNISPINYCLNDIFSHDFDQIIIGVNSYNNLKEILNFSLIKNNDKFNFRTKSLKLIDPRNWK